MGWWSERAQDWDPDGVRNGAQDEVHARSGGRRVEMGTGGGQQEGGQLWVICPGLRSHEPSKKPELSQTLPDFVGGQKRHPGVTYSV